MTPELWQTIQDLFHEALKRDPSERAGFLHSACSDPAVVDQVLKLLVADASTSGSVLDLDEQRTLPLERSSEAEDDFNEHIKLHRRIGPYHLVREIGRGGMGTVYLAQRIDLDKGVAIKVLRSGLATPETVDRFLQERRLLARLEHPNIGRLLDAGMVDGDTPYLVMEYIEGKPITTYCDEKQLTIKERFELFGTLCETVHYAHQNLVIHRDLKPANILVTPEGQVKLLDFGIAKLMEDEAEGLTRTGMRLMTLEYAAPEQIQGRVVTTATDVYALGILLYELLVGHRPYDLEGYSMSEIERVVCEKQPIRPSVAAGTYGEFVAQRAGADDRSANKIDRVRIRNAQRLRRRLTGDIDVICMKALAKEPSRRYASVEALTGDMVRHLTGRPVVARPSTLGYRARKFVERHRVGVAAATIVTVSMMAGIVGVTWQAREATVGWNQARLEAEKATLVTEFLTELFEASDPGETFGDTLTSYELLERGVNRVDQLSDKPLVQASLLEVIGRVYRNLGKYDLAEPHLQKSLSLRLRHAGDVSLEVAQSLHTLASLYIHTGKYDMAKPMVREALAIRQALLRVPNSEVAMSLNILAGLHRQEGAYQASDSLYRVALEMYDALDEEDQEEAATMNGFALLMRYQGRYAEAEALHRQALAKQREMLGPDHPYVATSLSNLAVILFYQGNDEEAEPIAREALAARQRLFGDMHPRIATSLNVLALILESKGDLDEAEDLFRRALRQRREFLGDDHPDVALTMKNLASLLSEKGLLDEAEELHREALAIRRTVLDSTHPDIAMSLWNLGNTLRDKKEFVEAESCYLQALRIYLKQFDGSNKRVKEVYMRLAMLYELWGKPEEAARYRVLFES